jgi:hypothetical protein
MTGRAQERTDGLFGDWNDYAIGLYIQYCREIKAKKNDVKKDTFSGFQL